MDCFIFLSSKFDRNIQKIKKNEGIIEKIFLLKSLKTRKYCIHNFSTLRILRYHKYILKYCCNLLKKF